MTPHPQQTLPPMADLNELRRQIEDLREQLDEAHKDYVAVLRAYNRALDQEWDARQQAKTPPKTPQ